MAMQKVTKKALRMKRPPSWLAGVFSMIREKKERGKSGGGGNYPTRYSGSHLFTNHDNEPRKKGKMKKV